MKKLLFIGLIAAFCVNLAYTYDRYSNESLIVIPKKYKDRRRSNEYNNNMLSNSDVILLLEEPLDDGYRRNYKRRDYRKEITRGYMRRNNIREYGDDYYDRRNDDRYDRYHDDGYYDRYDEPRPGIEIRIR